MSHQPSVMPSGPTEPDADRLRILLDNLNNLRSRLKSFAVIDKQGQAIGQVQDLILDAAHQLNLVIAQPDAPDNGHSFLLDGRQIQKVSVQAQSVFVDIAQAEVSSLPIYQTNQAPEETSPTASEIEDLFADTPEQPELTIAEPADSRSLTDLDNLGDLPEPESPAIDAFGDADLNGLELETASSAIDEDLSFVELTAEPSSNDALEEEFSFSSLVADPASEDLSNLDLGSLDVAEQLTEADFGNDLELTELSLTEDVLIATPESPETSAFSESLENLDLPLNDLELSSESATADALITDDLVGLEDIDLPVTEPLQDADTGFSELLSPNEPPETAFDLDLSELNGSADFGTAIADSVTESSLGDDFGLGESLSPETTMDSVLEFNLDDSQPSLELASSAIEPSETDLNLDFDQDHEFDLNLEDTGGLADLELATTEAMDAGFGLDESLLSEPTSEPAIDLDLLSESEPLGLGLEESIPDAALDLDLEAPATESEFDLGLEASTDALDFGLETSAPDLNLDLEAPAAEPGFDLGLEASTDALDFGFEESTPDLNLDLEASPPEPAFDLGLEASTDALDFGFEESTPDLNLDLEAPAAEPAFDLGLEASTDALDFGFEESIPDLNLDLEASAPEPALDLGLEASTDALDFGLESAAPDDLNLDLETSTPEPSFDLGVEASTDALDFGLEDSAPEDLNLDLEAPAAEPGFDLGLEEDSTDALGFGLEDSVPDLNLDLETSTPEPELDLGLEASTDALDFGLAESAPDLDLDLEASVAESEFDLELGEATDALDFSLEGPAAETETGFDLGLEPAEPDVNLALEPPTLEPEFDLGLAAASPDLELDLESPVTEAGFDLGLESSAPDLGLDLESSGSESEFDLAASPMPELNLDLESPVPPDDLDSSWEQDSTAPIGLRVDQTTNLTSFEPELAGEMSIVDNLSALDMAFSQASGTLSTEDLGDVAAGTAIAGLGIAVTEAMPSGYDTPSDRVWTEADLSPISVDESASLVATLPAEVLISPDTIIPPDSVDEAIELLEERLRVDYKRRKLGDVIIRKQIETRMIQVPVRYEKLVIEQVSPEQKPLAEVDLTEGQPINVELPDIMGQPTISGEFESPKAANYVLSAITKTLNHRCKKVRVEIELEDGKLQQSYQEWLDRCIDILKDS
ncbi:YsnF/AvaK domain-containing protein [Pantanalinema rosaneae CENA516]|uniref:YsnF/AvaK domain-containing protein n=1 Tax=Pantanalinema rosaneae TaxID=1620701 RepID=UPI003D6EF4DE